MWWLENLKWHMWLPLFLLDNAAEVPPPCHFRSQSWAILSPRPGWPQGPSLCNLTAPRMPQASQLPTLWSLNLEWSSSFSSFQSPGVTFLGKPSLTSRHPRLGEVSSDTLPEPPALSSVIFVTTGAVCTSCLSHICPFFSLDPKLQDCQSCSSPYLTSSVLKAISCVMLVNQLHTLPLLQAGLTILWKCLIEEPKKFLSHNTLVQHWEILTSTKDKNKRGKMSWPSTMD